MVKSQVKEMLVPFIYSGMKKIFPKNYPNRGEGYQPAWHTIKSGNLKGREIFIDPKDGLWQKEILEGNFEPFFFDYLNALDLRGKVVFEIGAHIGYHAMNFAQLVEETGLIYAFEPNMLNGERLELILTKSPDLAKRIKIFKVAISDRVGEIEFFSSSGVDDGRSSGSFIWGADISIKEEDYKNAGLKKVTVKTVALDKLFSSLGIYHIPDLIKIDVEGAENLVLQGGVHLISKYQPIILLEIHSIFNMLKTYEFFSSMDYKIELLKKAKDGRCFIAAKPQ